MTDIPMITLDEVKAQLAEHGRAMGRVNPREYHEWKGLLGGPVVSKSSLHEFQQDGAYKFFWKQEHGVRKESSGFAFGSAVDCLLLTPELWDGEYAVDVVDRRTKAGKERAAELDALGLTVLRPDEFEVVRQAASHLGELLEDRVGRYHTQVACWMRVTQVGSVVLPVPLVVTGMLDCLPCDPELGIVDAKTTSSDLANAKKVCWDAEAYGYAMQAALYLDLWNQCSGERRERFSFAYVESALPCRTRWARAEEDVILHGRDQYSRALMAYSEALDDDGWDDPQLPEMRLM